MPQYNIPSINFEYVYCTVYSFFGGVCTAFSDVDVEEASTSTIPASVATTSASLWESLWSVWSGFGIFGTFGAVVFSIFSVLWAFYSAVAYTISGLVVLFIFGSLLGLLYIRYKELSFYGTLPAETRTISPLKSRWEALLEDATSNDPKRWRRGVAEADGMLGELLAKLGYQGQNTAERLRNVPDDAFVTLPAAWEAHRVKNFVVASFSNYILTQREAFRTMKLFEQVFEEFDFI